MFHFCVTCIRLRAVFGRDLLCIRCCKVTPLLNLVKRFCFRNNNWLQLFYAERYFFTAKYVYTGIYICMQCRANQTIPISAAAAELQWVFILEKRSRISEIENSNIIIGECTWSVWSKLFDVIILFKNNSSAYSRAEVRCSRWVFVCSLCEWPKWLHIPLRLLTLCNFFDFSFF